MQIIYTKENVHVLALHGNKDHAPSQSFHLKQGLNEIPDNIWADNEKDPEIQSMFKSGLLKLPEAPKAKESPKAKGK